MLSPTLKIIPNVNSTVVTIKAQIIDFKIKDLLLSLFATTEKQEKQIPPAMSIVQCVCPRHKSSIAPYPKLPTKKNTIYLLTVFKKSPKIVLVVFEI